MFKPAKRQESKLRLALIGPSGSGKTMSALLIAKGIGGKIAMIDTERGSGSLYAEVCSYDIYCLEPPFTPERYVAAIREAAKAGYRVLIIDSLTHAWAGEGGILEFVDRASQAVKNNFAAWREASPKHSALVDAMIGAPMHIIATIRSKTAWEVVKDERTGKTRPVKIGLAPVQRDGLEYEFTTVLEMSIDGHIATATKDRTGLFDGVYFTPDQATGEKLRTWLTGEEEPEKLGGSNQKRPHSTLPALQPSPKPSRLDQGDSETRGITMIDVLNILRELGLGDRIEAYELYLQKKYGHDSIKDLEINQLREQFVNLARCKRDKNMFATFSSYLEKMKFLLEAA